MQEASLRIDAHIHFTPPELAADLAAFAEREPYWGLLLDPPEGRSIQGWASPERMIDDMDAAGIDRVVIVGEYFQQHDSCVVRNNQAIELVSRYPDRVMALATIQPLAGQKALDELARCLDNGLVGVGELNPYAQGYELYDRPFLKLAEACIAADVPINLHVSEEIGGYYLGKSSTPLRHYYHLACQFPSLKLILAHWGGGLLFYEMMPRVRKQLQNVWYDTAATPLLYPTKRIFRTALTCVTHRKILFGSDYPLLIYPRKMQEPDMRPFLSTVAKLDLSDEQRIDIMGNNAARLFGLLPTIKPASATSLQDNQEDIDDGDELDQITGLMPVSLAASEWPETEAIFEKYGIPYKDQPVPEWEPIIQAAVRKGLGPSKQAELLDQLNQLVPGEHDSDGRKEE